MLNRFFLILLLSLGVVFTFTGCEVIEGIFKAGFWLGVILVVIIVVAVIALMKKMKK